MRAQTAEHARDLRLVARGEENRGTGFGAEGGQLRFRQELRDRRAHLPGLVVHEVREALRAPLLRHGLQPLELGARERARRDEEANDRRIREHAELGAARGLRCVLDREAETEVRLVRPVLRHRLVPREPRERTHGRFSAERLE